MQYNFTTILAQPGLYTTDRLPYLINRDLGTNAGDGIKVCPKVNLHDVYILEL